VSERRAKQRRRLERIERTGSPENNDRTRVPRLGNPVPRSWNPSSAAATRAKENRNRDH